MSTTSAIIQPPLTTAANGTGEHLLMLRVEQDTRVPCICQVLPPQNRIAVQLLARLLQTRLHYQGMPTAHCGGIGPLDRGIVMLEVSDLPAALAILRAVMADPVLNLLRWTVSRLDTEAGYWVEELPVRGRSIEYPSAEVEAERAVIENACASLRHFAPDCGPDPINPS
jgi:hypothetical protein